MIDNKHVQKAEEELEYLTGDEETKRLAYLREKAIRDEMAAMTKARHEGEAHAKAETKKEIAKKMLAKKINLDTIIEITELTKEEIENL